MCQKIEARKVFLSRAFNSNPELLQALSDTPGTGLPYGAVYRTGFKTPLYSFEFSLPRRSGQNPAEDMVRICQPVSTPMIIIEHGHAGLA
jgi:hypothetical protein